MVISNQEVFHCQMFVQVDKFQTRHIMHHAQYYMCQVNWLILYVMKIQIEKAVLVLWDQIHSLIIGKVYNLIEINLLCIYSNTFLSITTDGLINCVLDI